MKRAAVALALIISACSQGDWVPPASVYRHYGDRLRVYLSPFFGQPCGTAWGARRSSEPPADQCYRFGPPQRIAGVLRTEGYSQASFYAGLKAAPNFSEDWDRSWRAVSDRYRLMEPWPKGGEQFRELRPKLFRIVFTGRTTEKFSVRGEHRIVIIDKVERIDRLPDER